MFARPQIPSIGFIISQAPVVVSEFPVIYAAIPPSHHLIDAGLVMRGAWNPREDSLLRNAVTRFGTDQWDIVAAVIPGRSPTQCRERWMFRIGPGLNKNPFEKWEDELILEEREKYGNHWTLISSHLPGRTSCAVKNRWYSVLRKHYRKRGAGKTSEPIPVSLEALLSHPVRAREELST
jgi:hypothetical protein